MADLGDKISIVMLSRFRNKALERLETELGDGGYPAGVARILRKRMNMIRAADSEQVFRALKSLHYEKLKGDRKHQRAIRLNEQWRLVLEIDESGDQPVVVIIGIEDYH